MLDEDGLYITTSPWPEIMTEWYEQLAEDFAVPVINDYELEDLS